MKKILTLFAVIFVSITAHANEPIITKIQASPASTGNTLNFHVTVKHDDEGWDHYADRFEILSPDGTILATRILHHPHVNEQPFTREQYGVAIPKGLTEVHVRARDSVHGYGPKKSYRLKN